MNTAIERHGASDSPAATRDNTPDHSHWTPPKMAGFIAALAASGSVQRAATSVAMSAPAAYDLRHRPDGVAFRIGWEAALLLARGRIADEVMEWALYGREEEVTRTYDRDADTITSNRIRHESRLAMSVLSRLDNRIANPPEGDRDAHAARIAAQDFASFLDLIEQGGDAIAVSLWIMARCPIKQAEIRARERCKLLTEREAQATRKSEEAEAEQVAKRLSQLGSHSFWTDDQGAQYTDLPPPLDFDGEEMGEYGEQRYMRTLTQGEIASRERMDEAMWREEFDCQELIRRSAFGLDLVDGSLPPLPKIEATSLRRLNLPRFAEAPEPARHVQNGLTAKQQFDADMRLLRHIDKIHAIENMDPAKVKTSDLHPDDDTTQWTDEQWARAVRSGWIDQNMPGWQGGG